MTVDGKMVDQVDVIIGERLKAMRLEKKMTQEDLGKACGVSFQQIQKYQTGVNRISASRLVMIADALNVSAGYFFAGLCRADRDGDDR